MLCRFESGPGHQIVIRYNPITYEEPAEMRVFCFYKAYFLTNTFTAATVNAQVPAFDMQRDCLYVFICHKMRTILTRIILFDR